MEVLCLMIKSWNIGIFLYSERMYVSTEKWCGLALRLLDYLGSLKSTYETQVRKEKVRGGWHDSGDREVLSSSQ